MRRLPGWLLLTVVGVNSAWLLTWAGIPAAFIFAGLLAGVACALGLSAERAPVLPRPVRPVAMAIIGVGAGSMLDAEVLTTLGRQAPAVLGAVLATIGVSLGIGQLLRRSPAVDGVTASFASVAGGASGVVTVARDYGADDRIVMALQYLRVLLVLAIIPVAVAWWFAPAETLDVAGASSPDGEDYLFTAIALACGLALAALWRFSASWLLLSLLVTVILVLAGPFDDVSVPALVSNAAYGAIGIQVGLGFTRATMRVLGRVMPLGLLQVALTVLACAGLGLLVAELAGVSRLDGFLATAPGGLPTAIAVATVAGDEVAFVVAAQVIRVAVALFLAPLIGAWFRRRRR